MRLRQGAAIPRSEMAAGLIGTAAVHALVALLFVASMLVNRSFHQPIVYSVELVAAPAARPATRPSAQPAPPAPPTVTTKPTPKKTAPVPKPKTPPKIDPKAEPATKPTAQETPNPGVTPGTGTDVENVRVTGAQFPFPDYLRRIVNEIFRRWARPVGVGALSAEVSFTIMRDGSVRDIRLMRSSRNYTFDLEAQGAVEQAGSDRAFGPLPEGWPSDLLQVAFLFTPRER